ncbi:PHP-associated [Candidatus Gugararchaeum adminiculabundum]|nr:PHP-associated [Candidatus Gugararchaeum adminiculabundum]
MLKIDFHAHSKYSVDSKSEITDIIKSARAKGLDGIVLLEHNNIAPMNEVRAKAGNFFIIFGEEISSSDGHIGAIGIKKPIPAGLSAKESVQLVHQQGGIAFATHPFSFRVPAVRFKYKSIPFDLMETQNASHWFSTKLSRLLIGNGLGGADAHLPEEVGTSYTLVDAQPNEASVIAALRSGKFRPVSNSGFFNYLSRFFKRRQKRAARPNKF